MSGKSWFDRLMDQFRIFFRAEEAVKKGYKLVLTLFTTSSSVKFPKRFFQLKFFNASYVVVDRGHLKELLNAPENTLSFHQLAVKVVESRYTFSESIAKDAYHVSVVREKSARNLPMMIPDIIDEVQNIFDELDFGDGMHIGHCTHVLEWTPVRMFEKALNMVTRVNARVTVGLPICYTP